MTSASLAQTTHAVRRGQLPAMLRALPRVLRWRPLVICLVVAAVPMVYADVRDAAGAAPVALFLGALVVGCGVGLTLEDEAATTLASSPTPLRARRGLQLVATGVVAAAAWMLLVLYSGRVGTAPVAWLSANAFALAAVGAASALRWGSVAAAPMTFGLVGAMLALPERWTMLALPGSPQWSGVRDRWLMLAVVGAMGVVHGLRDPAAR